MEFTAKVSNCTGSQKFEFTFESESLDYSDVLTDMYVSLATAGKNCAWRCPNCDDNMWRACLTDKSALKLEVLREMKGVK